MEYPRISVVVCTMDRLEDIRNCLGSLGRLRYPDYEVIVVDSSSANVVEAIRTIAFGYNAKYTIEKRKGLSIARNRGIRESDGEIVVFTDDDAMPEVSWLEEIAVAFANRDIGFACGKIFNAKNYADASLSVPQGIYENTFWGVNLAFRRGVLEEIGGFDETFQTAGEDQDIVIRALNAGFKGAYLPDAIVWHVKPVPRSIKKALKIEGRNGKADLFLLLKDARLFMSNLRKIPHSMVLNVFNTLCVLSLLPLIILTILLSMITALWFIPLTLILVYVAMRLVLGKAKGSALIVALIAPGLSLIYWFYLLQVSRQVRHIPSHLNV